MATDTRHVTAAEIARLSGVTRATVSNWRRRHTDFPAPAGGTETSPTFDLAAVETWLGERGRSAATSASGTLRLVLRATGDYSSAERLIPLVLVAVQDEGFDTDGADQALARRASAAVRGLSAVPGAAEVHFTAADAELIRTTVACARADGPRATVDVLAEGTSDGAKAGGLYATPEPLAALMAALLGGPGGHPRTVLDPACGSGALLAAAAAAGSAEVAGQEIDLAQAQRTAVRLLLDGTTSVEIRVGDSLRDDAFPSVLVGGVLCNPPAGNRDWGNDELALDGRWRFGVPARIDSELAWVQHALSHLDTGGRAVLLVPPAVASRTSGRRIRAELVRSGALRGVVALPAGAVPGIHVGPHLWLLRSPGDDRTERVLFVDVTDRADGRQVDWPQLADDVRTAWHGLDSADDMASMPFAACAAPVAVLDDDVDLAPIRHVRAARPIDPAALTDTRSRLSSVLSGAADLLGSVAIHESAAARRDWRTATVADLVRGGALTLHRVDPGSTEIVIEVGDVLIPAAAGARARVATTDDAGAPLGRHVHLLRPDTSRIDPWFAAGFVAEAGGATPGSTAIRVDPRKIRIPLMPLDEQRDYGRSFRQLHQLRSVIDRAATLADELTGTLSTGLAAGALIPADDPNEDDR